MSRNTVARASFSRKVRIRPGCSSTYQRPSGAWNAPVIELNVSPPSAFTSCTCGRAGGAVGATVGAIVGATVGATVGAGVDGCAVGVALAVRDADAAGDALSDSDCEGGPDKDGPLVVAGLPADRPEHAHARTMVAATARRPGVIRVTLDRVTMRRLPRYGGAEL